MSRTQLPAWQALSHLAVTMKQTHLNQLFATDDGRAERFSLEMPGLLFDYSKQRVNEEVMTSLVALAEESGLVAARDAMYAGEHINITEDRAVLHVALRSQNAPAEVVAELEKIAGFVNRVRSGEWRGFSGETITDVVSIGIGGSHLGPEMVTEALDHCADDTLAVHYVSNVDGAQIASVLAGLDAARTLFVVSSKTFTTSETMTNAASAQAWLSAAAEAAGVDAVVAAGHHFVAVSTNIDAATAMGILPANIFTMWDWVGGRFSLWSAIGLPIALRLGFDNFAALLAGANAVDEHFRTQPIEQNIPVIMALLSVWNTTFMGFEAQAILPYEQVLHRLPAYLQQAEMESNGKTSTKAGEWVDYNTVPLIWGEVGINGQHAFYQFLHQSPNVIPSDFIGALRPSRKVVGHHDVLMANFLAQSKALMTGVDADEVRAELTAKGLSEARIAELIPHKIHAGNRPSSTLLLDQVTPQTLGALIALYEHKIFTQGVLLDICSFDQWGVELGKIIAKQIQADIEADGVDDANLAQRYDASTAQLMARYKRARSE